MKKKVNNLVRLHEAMQEELKTDHIQNKSKFFPWYLINGLKCTVENIIMSWSTLLKLYMKSRK